MSQSCSSPKVQKETQRMHGSGKIKVQRTWERHIARQTNQLLIVPLHQELSEVEAKKLMHFSCLGPKADGSVAVGD